ncbi:class II fructose-bisphosphate aldolase [Candidatus Curtissbacteria bacterium]|nr:class II fructose-bisphosphate aldolase [Candidatus Curtissbacteria bacterium]
MTAREWFQRAKDENFAIGAFNVDNLDVMRAICEAGRKMKSPVMLEFSPGEVEYFGFENIADLVENTRKDFEIPILLNLDHSSKVDDCLAALRLRSGSGDPVFDNVHFDGSELSLEENIEATKRVVEAAKAKGTLVEGEIDRLPGSSEVHDEELDPEVVKKSYTDPVKAQRFIQESGVDIFAAVFGNVHGTFPNQPDLDFDLLSSIRKALPNTFLSMHGGSGIPAVQVKKAIGVGKIVKVNVNTELRAQYRDALDEALGAKVQEQASYKLAPDIVRAVAAVVEGKIEVFGSGGKI